MQYAQPVNAQTCLPDQTFNVSRSFSGVRSCGDRGRQESEARAACLNDARAKFGASASLTLVTDPPSFRGDADQRSGVCARRVLGACVDFKDECSGRVDVNCSVKVCFP